MAPSFQMHAVSHLVPNNKGQITSAAHCWGPGHGNDTNFSCWKGGSEVYSTSVIGNMSLAWINQTIVEHPDTPFFAYIAPKAAHDPFDPAPWYTDTWESAWPPHEPRTPNWNMSKESRRNHAANVASQPMLSQEAAGSQLSILLASSNCLFTACHLPRVLTA